MLAEQTSATPLGGVAPAQIDRQLSNRHVTASFGAAGLTAIRSNGPGETTHRLRDSWSLTIGDDRLGSQGTTPTVRAGTGEITYVYRMAGYEIEVVYRLHPEWSFVTKELVVVHAPKARYTLHGVAPMLLELEEAIADARVPTNYTPQLERTIEETHRALPGRDFGVFLRLGGGGHAGLMLLAQNPYLDTAHTDRLASVRYAPELVWDQSWGPFHSDAAILRPYRTTGRQLPREMLLEWKLPATEQAEGGQDGLDAGEIDAFTDCVRAFLLSPPAEPSRVEVGWTLNDYQVDVATSAGVEEYHRIIDATADLGLTTLLFAPTNSSLAKRDDDTDRGIGSTRCG